MSRRVADEAQMPVGAPIGEPGEPAAACTVRHLRELGSRRGLLPRRPPLTLERDFRTA